MSWPLLIELMVKSSLIAGAGLGLSALFRMWPASDRAAILRGSVLLLIALPILVALAPGLPLAWLPASENVVAPVAATRSWAVDLQPLAAARVEGSLPAASPWPLLAAATYGLGLTIIVGRFLMGLGTLHRWTRNGRPVAHRTWLETLRRLDVSGRTRLIASPRVHAPLSWGLPPGTVLVSEGCVQRPETASAVLAHELAHIRRKDWPFMALSWLAVALFWFNPLVWLLHASLSARTEEAADAEAVDQMEPQAYARALVDLASDFNRPAAAIGMAAPGNALTRRIACIMKTSRKSPSRPLAMALTIGAMVAVATPLAAIELTAAEPTISTEAQAAAEDAATDVWPVVQTTATVETTETPRIVQSSESRSVWWFSPVPPAPPASPAPPAPPAPPDGWPKNPGTYRFYSNHSDADIERQVASARASADQARERASQTQAEAERMRLDLDAVRRHALIAAEQATVEARQALIQARAEMRAGADELEKGAEELRAEAARLQDPAYRARVISDNRSRAESEGRIYDVTDAELRALSRSLPHEATRLDIQAQALRRQAERNL